MKSIYVFITGLLILCSSCVDIIDISEDFYEDHIILNSILEPDSITKIYISKSTPITGKVHIYVVENSEVHITDEETMDEYTCMHDSNGCYIQSEFIAIPGKSYTVNVTTENFKDLSSFTRIPEKPIIDQVIRMNDSISLHISDNPSEQNYYLVSFKAMIDYYDCYYLPDSTYTCDRVHRYKPLYWMESDDNIIEAFIKGWRGHINNFSGLTLDDDLFELEPDYSGDSFLFSDMLFQGENREIKFRITDWTYSSLVDSTLDMYVYSIDYNYYKYLLTFAQQCTTSETPFTDVASVYNNIEGGYGIFGSKNGVKIQLAL